MPLTPTDERVRDLVISFPRVYEQAVDDLAKYKLALAAGAVPPALQSKAAEWFNGFPQLWNLVRANWEEVVDGRKPTAEQLDFANRVNRWIIRLRGEPGFERTGLGLVFLIIAGVAVAASLVGAIGWAVGYVKEQNNLSSLIDGAVRGVIPPEVVSDALKTDRRSFLEKVEDTATNFAFIALFGLAAFLVLPGIMRKFKARGAA